MRISGLPASRTVLKHFPSCTTAPSKLRSARNATLRPLKYQVFAGNRRLSCGQVRGFSDAASSGTPPDPSNSTGPRYAPQPTPFPIIKTLRPERLISEEQQILDFSNQTTKVVMGSLLDYYIEQRQHVPFPEATIGFLYYTPGPTEVAGQVRLRICEDASTFDKGRDLLVEGMWPWCINFSRLAQTSKYRPLLNVMIRDELVTERFIEECKTFLLSHTLRWHRPPLYTLSDPFYIDISQQQHIMQSLTPGYHTQSKFDLSHKTTQYGGFLQVRFELSTFPEHRQYGPTLVLKVLEIVKPIHPLVPKPTSQIFAVPGDYFCQSYSHATRRKPAMWRLPFSKDHHFKEFEGLLQQPNIIYSKYPVNG